MLALAAPTPGPIPGLHHSPEWHREQEDSERAWLDQWARAERTPECPWARPDYDVMADFSAFLSDLHRTQGRP